MKEVRLKTSVEWLTSEEMEERIKLEPTEE
jgi:hypothetical protein